MTGGTIPTTASAPAGGDDPDREDRDLACPHARVEARRAGGRRLRVCAACGRTWDLGPEATGDGR